MTEKKITLTLDESDVRYLATAAYIPSAIHRAAKAALPQPIEWETHPFTSARLPWADRCAINVGCQYVLTTGGRLSGITTTKAEAEEWLRGER